MSTDPDSARLRAAAAAVPRLPGAHRRAARRARPSGAPGSPADARFRLPGHRPAAGRPRPSWAAGWALQAGGGEDQVATRWNESSGRDAASRGPGPGRPAGTRGAEVVTAQPGGRSTAGPDRSPAATLIDGRCGPAAAARHRATSVAQRSRVSSAWPGRWQERRAAAPGSRRRSGWDGSAAATSAANWRFAAAQARTRAPATRWRGTRLAVALDVPAGHRVPGPVVHHAEAVKQDRVRGVRAGQVRPGAGQLVAQVRTIPAMPSIAWSTK